MHCPGSHAVKQPQLGEAHSGRALKLSEVHILDKAVHGVEQKHKGNHIGQRVQEYIITSLKIEDCHDVTKKRMYGSQCKYVK